MLIVVSPAKRLDESPARAEGGTIPMFEDEAGKLARAAGRLSQKKLSELMDISADLAKLNAGRYGLIGTGEGAKPAVEMFAGDTYQGLEAGSLDEDELAWAQDHLRILSGMYGLLRPRDVIQPHRLEMGTRLKTRAGKNLYEFWGDRVAEALNAQAAEIGTGVLLNCASVEYFTAADRDALGLEVVTPTFLEPHAKGPRVVSFYAKQARGAMARFVIQRRITDPAALRDFDAGGYRYQPDESSPARPVFLRDEAS